MILRNISQNINDQGIANETLFDQAVNTTHVSI